MDDEIPELIPDAAENHTAQSSDVRVPVTIITGYLGSGKTTLITNILTENHGKKIAVILNEFGASLGIDKSLIMSTPENSQKQVEEWIELSNGCICCSLKDAGVKALEELLLTRNFQYIFLETTGLADPGPIAKLFWQDNALESQLVLDSIITVLDAKYVMLQMKEGNGDNECMRQIAYADKIILNKKDLVIEENVNEILDVIKSVNDVNVCVTERSQVPMDFVFDVHAYERFVAGKYDIYKSSHLDLAIQTVSFAFSGVASLENVDTWIQYILWENQVENVKMDNVQVLRLKGVLNDGREKRIIVQGVRELYDKHEGSEWGLDERLNRIVLIGKGLKQYRSLLRESFQKSCLLN